MAETAAILNPGTPVLLPDLEAGCSLSDSCPAPEFERFIQAHPGHLVISYINCSAAVKALSDIICTSSNAERIVRNVHRRHAHHLRADQHWPLRHQQTGRDMVLWPGRARFT
jgi:quinolinate synthase